jgi:hypothetical protein
VFALKSLAVGSAAAAFFAVGVPAAHASGTVTYAPAEGVAGQPSADWSGWDVTAGSYRSVSAAWTVPAVTCGPGETSYSADWVGLDGDGSSSVEQIGTSSNCNAGTPSYSAWYEFFPQNSVSLPGNVNAGDQITASVQAVNTAGQYNLILTDTTQHWTKTQSGVSPAGTGASAEIIAEAPSGSANGNSVLPLANFKTASFSHVLVNGQKIGDIGSARKITMVDGAGNPMATVSGLASADAFTVTWISDGAAALAQDVRVPVSSGWPQTGAGSDGGSTGPGNSGGTGTGTSDGWGYPGWGYTGWGSTGLSDPYGYGSASTSGSDPYGYGYGYGYGSASTSGSDPYGYGVTSGNSPWQS